MRPGAAARTCPPRRCAPWRDFARRELPRLDVHPRLFRYAWFMPRVTGVLDHDDLLADDPAGGRTPLGELYLGGASR